MSILDSDSTLHPSNSDIWAMVHLDDGVNWSSTPETLKQYFWEVHYEIVEWEMGIGRFFSYMRKSIETP